MILAMTRGLLGHPFLDLMPSLDPLRCIPGLYASLACVLPRPVCHRQDGRAGQVMARDQGAARALLLGRISKLRETS